MLDDEDDEGVDEDNGRVEDGGLGECDVGRVDEDNEDDGLVNWEDGLLDGLVDGKDVLVDGGFLLGEMGLLLRMGLLLMMGLLISQAGWCFGKGENSTIQKQGWWKLKKDH